MVGLSGRRSVGGRTNSTWCRGFDSHGGHFNFPNGVASTMESKVIHSFVNYLIKRFISTFVDFIRIRQLNSRFHSMWHICFIDFIRNRQLNSRFHPMWNISSIGFSEPPIKSPISFAKHVKIPDIIAESPIEFVDFARFGICQRFPITPRYNTLRVKVRITYPSPA